MDDITHIDRLESEYRKENSKNAEDVLSSSILCAICKTDLKQNIISNKSIMVHKTFLCLCCENCFEQLSNSQNGCIFCNGMTCLKECEKCDSKMCKKCVDGYVGLVNINSSIKCLRCHPKWLWSERCQAADVLNCFSLELDTMLFVSGEESEEKQNVVKCLISTAKCNEDLSQEAIDRRRVKLLCDSFKSKIEMSLNNLKNKDTKEKKNQLPEVCNTILFDTCKVILDLKGFLDQSNSGQLNTFNNKVKTILKVNDLHQNTEKDIEQNVGEASNSVRDNLNLNPEFKQETFENENMNFGRKSEIKLSDTSFELKLTEALNTVHDNVNLIPTVKSERLDMKLANENSEKETTEGIAVQVTK